ncbi:aldehyde dehydrogenase family protein [Actinophytocola oryzae]|uniref:Acyl-CoA reductase-like NAD-dependent aldehyde dehydrogenase n=1 Tax=Actinophytocola oryzae TaxID=502181 RepID=A0A4R7W1Z7_9PSEU|nr:aldehyde dehydrogenase family protein [Actinophytocola oryzae]TDV56514.1 acyl-CoA reductase-like NAD-dependent aldehyde dehydrogenase [Actinophytocola oryzae]
MTTVTVPAMIGGEPHTTGRWYDTVDPATEQVLAAVADCSAADADTAVHAAADAFPTWSALPLDRRRAVLAGTAARLAGRRAELVDLAVADTGALPSVAEKTQVGAAIARLEQWAAAPDDLLAVPSPADRAGLTSVVRRTPVGVVACISPYNFPLLAMVGKIVPALFAGDTVVLKPAPQDPLLVVALAEALRDALAENNAPAGAVNLLTGADGDLGAALVRHPLVRAVSFTGSTAVGIRIHQDAAPTMKRLLLELGGKGAVIVRADADPTKVVAAITRTWTVQSGQVCLTPARIIADAAVHDDVVAGLRAALADLGIGDPRDPSTTVGPVISAAQRARVEELTASAEDEGCAVERRDDLPARGFYAAPALITGAAPEHTVMQEEVFGPVLTVMRAVGDDEAVAAANSTRYALSDYVFSPDLDAAHAIAARLHSAQVGINTTARHPDAPFGGNRASGIGRSGGAWSLDACTDIQTTTEQGGTNA